MFPSAPGNTTRAWRSSPTASRSRCASSCNVNDETTAPRARSGHHNWVIANQRTAAALKAKGYQYRYVFGQNAGHCEGKVQNATLADALVWVWRGYPLD